jgi:hypothetical protein
VTSNNFMPPASVNWNCSCQCHQEDCYQESNTQSFRQTQSIQSFHLPYSFY